MKNDNELILEAYSTILNEGSTPFNSERFIGTLQAVVPLLKDDTKSVLGLAIIRGILDKFFMEDYKSKNQATKLAQQYLVGVSEENLKKVIDLIQKRKGKEISSWDDTRRASELEYKASPPPDDHFEPESEESSYRPTYVSRNGNTGIK
jgi:hypothetical protein